MSTNHFWNWTTKASSPDNSEKESHRTLYLEGVIAPETWFDDEVSPALFKEELNSASGPITVVINSPGGDCVAAAQIYNMLTEYPFPVTVKIDGIAASAASVVAMAGDSVLMSPVSTMMIHNPATIAMGDHTDMEKAIQMLDAVKESIVNAYELKTGLSRKEISKMMDAETWFDARKAIELGFADGMIGDPSSTVVPSAPLQAEESAGMLFSRRTAEQVLVNKMSAAPVCDQPEYTSAQLQSLPLQPEYDLARPQDISAQPEYTPAPPEYIPVQPLYERLDHLLHASDIFRAF